MVQPERHGPVDRQHIGIRQPFRPKIGDQAAAKTGTVDEKVGLKRFAVVEDQRRDVAFCTPVRRHHLRIDNLDPCRFPTQVFADQRLIKMIGVMERPHRHDPAVGFPSEGAFVMLQQMSEQVMIGHRLAGRYRIFIQIRPGAVWAFHHLMRVINRPVV